jgi:hypothetical protein
MESIIASPAGQLAVLQQSRSIDNEGGIAFSFSPTIAMERRVRFGFHA